ncbi:putative Ubiquitin-activating enzyme E1b [Fasciola gigantica]|uniref:SUMO-activating enzyme subunit n=1 Tax=Fasciola gigantica TaxID=46835 RepID=A0A504Z246_FASGI|nr:putative Ubiquitin-activating enzyme E1b [Fasciola gigantica]
MIRASDVKVLVVGAGGIGCELLKDLVIDGFKNITIVDLDTIDISNLNRQFLFHKCHVGRSKAEVAKESVLEFCSNAKVTAFHKSIFSSYFDCNFFSGFDIVFNALDNQAARRHVNRLCWAAKRPLIESGTAGYLGQVEPFIPLGFPVVSSSNGMGKCSPSDISEGSDGHSKEPGFCTGCFECQPRETGQRTFPTCTIRNTPSEPIHCVVWAKYLFNNLFGASDFEDEEVSPDASDLELQKTMPKESGDLSMSASSDGANNTPGAGNKASDCGSVTLREWFRQKWSSCMTETSAASSKVPDCVRALAWRLFHDDIVTLVGMRDLWVDRQDRQEPTPLSEEIVRESLDCSQVHNAPSPDRSSLRESNPIELRDQRMLAPSGWLRLFLDSTCALQKRLISASGQELSWDKDDDDSMDFVAGAAILRAHLFHLSGAERLTRFTMKSLAGNIVPAIATTNAVVAGLMVLQAHHVLSRNAKHIRTIYLHRNPTGRHGNRRLVVPCEPSVPNPSCLVCSPEATKSQLRLYCILSSLTLRVIRDRILIRNLGMLAPDVELTERGLILISSEEGETDEACEAASQSEKQSHIAKDLAEGWCLIGDLQAFSEAKEGLANNHSATSQEAAPASSLSKRMHDVISIASDGTVTHDAEPDGPRPTKRARLSVTVHCPNPVDVIVEDDDDDLIMLE